MCQCANAEKNIRTYLIYPLSLSGSDPDACMKVWETRKLYNCDEFLLIISNVTLYLIIYLCVDVIISKIIFM